MNPQVIKIIMQSILNDWLIWGGGNRAGAIRRPDDVPHQSVFETEGA